MQERIDPPMKMSIISNIIFEPSFYSLIKQYFVECKTEIHAIPYEEHIEQSYRIQLSESDEIIVWLNFENLLQTYNSNSCSMQSEQLVIDGVANICRQLCVDIARSSTAHILWFLFEDYDTKIPITTGHTYVSLVDKLNLKLVNQLSDQVNFIDLKRLIAKVGIDNAYSSKGKYRWNAPYSKILVKTAALELHKQYLITKGVTKKCLVLDCDNVLWGGILSEDGIENLKLSGSGFGRSYQDFQRFVLSLHYRGVSLAICSKNNLSDVMVMFREHSEMVLKEEHISCFQVDWNNKPDNIKKISELLNIGLDSIAFVDDSPIEIEAVNAILPEVTTILYERDSIYGKFSFFNLKNNAYISDIEKRNKTYQTNQYRKNLKAQYKNYDEYINALKMKIEIHEALPIEYSRISELTQRTNKCTNGIRYTISDIKRRTSADGVFLYSLFVSDCFSDLGLVGALEIDGETLTLISLSCRALGRKIESEMLAFAANKHRITSVVFRPTGKNEDLKVLLLNAFSSAAITS